MKFQRLIILLMAFILFGCVPKGQMLKNRELQFVEAGLGVDGTQRIIESNLAVDSFADEVSALLAKEGFQLLHRGVSWGLAPLTGHTLNLNFRYPGTNALHCYVQISKKEFQVKFYEIESKLQSNHFATNEADLVAMRKASESLSTLARQKIPNRAVRISSLDYGELSTQISE